MVLSFASAGIQSVVAMIVVAIATVLLGATAKVIGLTVHLAEIISRKLELRATHDQKLHRHFPELPSRPQRRHPVGDLRPEALVFGPLFLPNVRQPFSPRLFEHEPRFATQLYDPVQMRIYQASNTNRCRTSRLQWADHRDVIVRERIQKQLSHQPVLGTEEVEETTIRCIGQGTDRSHRHLLIAVPVQQTKSRGKKGRLGGETRFHN